MAQDPSSYWAVVDPELWLMYMQNSPSAFLEIWFQLITMLQVQLQW